MDAHTFIRNEDMDAMVESPSPAVDAAPSKRLAEQPRKRRGFAAMDQATLRTLARKGGIAAHERGHAHEFTTEEARAAGRKGGCAPHRSRGHSAHPLRAHDSRFNPQRELPLELDNGMAFIADPRRGFIEIDDDAEAVGEQFIASATSGEAVGEAARNEAKNDERRSFADAMIGDGLNPDER